MNFDIMTKLQARAIVLTELTNAEGCGIWIQSSTHSLNFLKCTRNVMLNPITPSPHRTVCSTEKRPHRSNTNTTLWQAIGDGFRGLHLCHVSVLQQGIVQTVRCGEAQNPSTFHRARLEWRIEPPGRKCIAHGEAQRTKSAADCPVPAHQPTSHRSFTACFQANMAFELQQRSERGKDCAPILDRCRCP